MSAYERERAEHIQRNKERMMALQIPGLASHVGPQKEARPAKPKGITSKRQKSKVRLNHCAVAPRLLAAYKGTQWQCSLTQECRGQQAASSARPKGTTSQAPNAQHLHRLHPCC